ncbi:MAG: RHS repeat-associated core domain-containing protein [Thermodesulfobacteriota bacterium]
MLHCPCPGSFPAIAGGGGGSVAGRLPRGTLPPLLLFLIIFSAPLAAAAPAGPGWYSVQGEPVSTEQAAVHYASLAAATASGQATTQSITSPAQPSPEITELARALQNDPKLIYEYVHNHIEYVPYFGSLKGATLTYLDGAGNDFDQASLLVELLRASGYTAQYVYGRMDIPAHGASDQKDMQHWLSVDPDNTVIGYVLANGGIPATLWGPFWTIYHVWVQATISGTPHLLDPAFKVHREIQGMSMAEFKTAMAYDHQSLLTAAGGTEGTDYVQNLNETGLGAALNGYAMNLVTHLRANSPNAGMEEIIGGREIVPEYPAQLPTTLPFPFTAEEFWTDIPDNVAFVHKVTIQHGQINKAFSIAELSGKRLSLTYSSGGVTAASGEPVIASDAGAPVANLAAAPIPLGDQPVVRAPEAAAETILPDKSLTAPSPAGDSSTGGMVSTMGTYSADFGKIHPPEAGTRSNTLTLGPATNPNSFTVQVVVSLASNPTGAFSITAGGGTTSLPAGQSMNFTVKFANTGQTPGTKTGQLRLQWQYTNGTTYANDYINLAGTVAQPIVLGGYGVNVGAFMNEPYVDTARLQNNGSLPLDISNITLTGTGAASFQFVSGNGAGTIPAGGYRDIQVRYLASVHGVQTAMIAMTFTYDGLPYNPVDILPLQGQAFYRPDLTGSVGLDVGQVYQSNPKEGTVRLQNSGTLVLTIDKISLTGTDASHFLVTGGNGAGTVNPGQYRDISVSYLADAIGQHSADVQIEFTYDGLSSQSINLPLDGETLSTPLAQLWLDDDLIAEESAPVFGANLDTLTISVDHPYLSDNGTFADQSAEYHLRRGATYAIGYDFGASRDGRLLEKRQRRLQTYRDKNLPDDSREVLTETLNVIGTTWMRDTSLYGDLTAQLAGVMGVFHHRFGIVAQETGYYVDVSAQFYCLSPRHHNPANPAAASQAYLSMTPLYSAMEHGVLEQMQVNRPAVSTVKLLQLHNAAGGKTFMVNLDLANFATVAPQLTGYSDTDLQGFQSAVNAGSTLILPANGQIPLQEWAGKGYIDYRMDATVVGIGMIIGGDYHGGYSANMDPLDVAIFSSYLQTDTLPDATAQVIPSEDPVDMATGAFLTQNTDLTLRGGAGGMALKRSYTSANNTVNGPFGHGWSHNYNLYAEEHSDSEIGLGMRTPVDAAALLTAAVVTEDLLASDTPSLKEWLTSALVAKWGMDQLTNNAVSLHLDNDVLTFAKLPDGSFNSPPGVTARLENYGGLYRLTERFGRTIEFDQDRRVSWISDLDGNFATFSYYTDGKLYGAFDSFQHSLIFGYTGDLLSSVTDSAGRSVSYGYNGSGNLISFTDAAGQTWGYGYDDAHRLLSLTSPSGITTVTNSYDELGRVKSQTVPRQYGSTIYNLYFSGYRNVEEDGIGNRTVYHFDNKKRLVGVEDALGNLIENAYDGRDHLVETIDPNGNLTRYGYDGADNLISVTDPLGNQTTNTYDWAFHLTDVTDPLGHVTHTDYDPSHHPWMRTVHPSPGNPVSTRYMYYGNGLLLSSVDGNGTPSYFSYDPYGNPATGQIGARPPVSYQYNAQGLRTRLTDQVGMPTTFTYDSRDLLLSRTDPLGKTATSTYDSNGRLQSKTDRNSRTITYSYTNSGKLQTIQYPDARSTNYVYDQRDLLVQRQDSLGTTSFAYDAVGRITGMTDPHGYHLLYQYDATGNLTRITYPDGRTVSYTYDALNRLATVSIDWLGKTATYVYDAAGRAIGLTQFNGSVVTATYDNADRLTDLENLTAPASTAIAAYHFTLDNNGNRIGATQEVPGAPVIAPASLAMTYNYQRNRLLTAGSTGFTYDDEGQLTGNGAATHTFDFEHRLTGISGVINAQFRYDGAGNRLEATRNGVVTRYIYDLNGNLIAEMNDTGIITRYYIHGAGLLAMVTPSGALYCYHFDATGHTVALTDGNRQTVNAYAYTPFGTLAGESESVAQPFKYAGKFGVMSEPNGYYYMRARYYDPQVGRFISEDPLGFDGGDLNLYAYVGNNPVMGVDPLGLCEQNNGIDYFDLGVSSVGALKDYYTLTQISTPAGAALNSASLLVNKLGVVSAISPNSNVKGLVDLGLNGAGLGLAVATGGTGAVVMATVGVVKAAYNTPVIGTNQTVGEWWTATINGR